MDSLSTVALLLLIAFASINAVLFTPALPDIATYFHIPAVIAEQSVTWFLIGYTGGQLVYGPISSRFGYKKTLYLGITIAMMSCFICITAGYLHQFNLLLFGRFLLALGSGVGLKMTYTLVNENYPPSVAAKKISYLVLSFAVTPNVGIAIGGYLNYYFGWLSCFYASIVYAMILSCFVIKLPEKKTTRDHQALKWRHILRSYQSQFSNSQLIAGGLLMGCCAAFVYVFAAIGPFIAINLYGLSSTNYGLANLLPALGLVAGALVSAHYSTFYSFMTMILAGIGMTAAGVITMLIAVSLDYSAMLAIFFPSIFVFFGLSLIIPNASTLAMSATRDKTHGSSVMSFTNMAFATSTVLLLGLFKIKAILLPMTFMTISLLMFMVATKLEERMNRINAMRTI